MCLCFSQILDLQAYDVAIIDYTCSQSNRVMSFGAPNTDLHPRSLLSCAWEDLVLAVHTLLGPGPGMATCK